MELVILPGFVWIGIGITVFTAVQAGIIRSYIPAFDAMTALAHPFVFQIFEQQTIRFS